MVSWDEFQLLDDERLENGEHYELHDGDVVVVPLPRPRHKGVQGRLVRLLRFVEDFGFAVREEFEYRPALNHQFWRADLAITPASLDTEMMKWEEWHVYSPPMIIEVLSPSEDRFSPTAKGS